MPLTLKKEEDKMLLLSSNLVSKNDFSVDLLRLYTLDVHLWCCGDTEVIAYS